MAIAELRREYRLAGLDRQDLHPDPMVQFGRWFDQATGARFSGRIQKLLIGWYKKLLFISGIEPTEVNAMTLATVDAVGRPSARVVLLKGADARGFTFFTNYDSRKGRELAENPVAALVFYWADLERQVCASGPVSRLSEEESETYFKSRPRGSQIGAWASNQSSVIPDRKHLERRWREFEQKYPEEVPKPPNWGGFILRPDRIEFWQGRPNRLHDRFQYTKSESGVWLIARLSP
jgi:pyridoxamine 5'-phosphate oxidase